MFFASQIYIERCRNSQQVAPTVGAKRYSLLVNTMGRWEIEKFSRNNDFELWKVKMQAILIQEKCIDALKS